MPQPEVRKHARPFPSPSPSARRYDLDVRTLRFDPSDPLGHGFWHDLEHAAAVSRVVLWPGRPAAEVRDRLDAMDLDVVVFDPAGAAPGDGDFLSVMRSNLARLEAGLGAAQPRDP